MNINDNKLLLAISDNGTGFDLHEEEKVESMGLQGMYQRADMIEAKLEITSQPREGTQIYLTKEV